MQKPGLRKPTICFLSAFSAMMMLASPYVLAENLSSELPLISDLLTRIAVATATTQGQPTQTPTSTITPAPKQLPLADDHTPQPMLNPTASPGFIERLVSEVELWRTVLLRFFEKNKEEILVGVIASLIAAALLAFWGRIRRFLSRKRPKPPLNIPKLPPRKLIGRQEERTAIKTRLLGKDDHIPVAAITGMPGVGKTSLAIQVAQDIRRKFRRDGVAWVTWRSTEGDEMLTVLQKFGVLFHADEVVTCDNTLVCATRLLNVLRAKQALIVLDDVPENRVTELQSLLPPPERCAALITSRGKGVPGVQPGGEHKLNVLTQQEALALLEDALGKRQVEHEKEAAQRICKMVDGHPLALTIAAGLLLSDRSRNWSLDQYARELEAEKERLDNLEDRTKPEGKEYSVRFSVALSYRILDGIDKKRFRLLAMLKSPEIRAEVVAILWDVVEHEADRELDRLALRSLIERIDRQSWRLHVLLRLFAEECLEPEERVSSGSRLADYYVEYVKQHNREDEYPELDAEWENFQQAMDWAKTGQKDETAVELALETRAYFDKRGWWRVKRDWLREGVGAARRLNKRPQLLEGLNDLGAECIWHGPYPEARDCYNEMMQIGLEVESARIKSRALQQLGDAETLLGKYSAARDAFEQALALYENPREWFQKAQTTEGMSRVLMLQRDYEGARIWYEKSIDLWNSRGERKGLASALCGLASVARLEGKREEASSGYTEALELYRQLGSKWGDRVGLGDAFHGKGELALRIGEHGQAKKLFQTARLLYRRSEYGLGQAQTLEGLGLVSEAEGNQLGACGSYEDALQLFQELGHWPGEARVQYRLGELAYVQCRYSQARAWYNHALKLYKEQGIEEPWILAETAFKAGEVARLQGYYDEAIQRYRDAKQAFRQQNNEQGEADIQLRLGDLALLQGNIKQARGLLDYALNLYEELSNVSGRARVLRLLGTVAELEGRRTDARESYESALRLFQISKDKVGQAQTLLDLGQLDEERYQREGDPKHRKQARKSYVEAYRHYEPTRRHCEEVQDKLGQAKSLLGLGMIATLVGEGQIAREYLEAALAQYKQMEVRLGEARVLQGLGEVARLEGKDSEAKEHLVTALTLYEQMEAPLEQAKTLVALGKIAQLFKHYGEGRQNLQTAMDRYEKYDLRAQEALVQLALGNLENAAGQKGTAREYYESTVKSYSNLGDGIGEAQALYALAWLEQEQNLLRHAAQHYSHALTIVDDLGGTFGEQVWQKLKTVLQDFEEFLPNEFDEWRRLREGDLDKWRTRWGETQSEDSGG